MRNRRRTTRLTTALALGAALLLQARAWAQSPAELAPADTPIFIHVNELSNWFGELTDGPIGQKWRTEIQKAQGSGDLLTALGMNVDQFMDAYFGGDVVILGTGNNAEGKEGPGAIFTKVDQADRNRAIESLGLTKVDAIAGNPVYTGADGDGYIVMTDNWVAMCDLDSYEYLQSVLTQADNAPRLADSETYMRWTKGLPADRSMTLLAIENETSQHAIGVVRKGKGMDATYLGTSPDYDDMMAILGETSVAEFGPLPAEASAITFNIKSSAESRTELDKLDLLMGGKSFVDDLLPKLDAPTVLFASSVPGNNVDPNVDVQVPVMGMAFKMNDPAAAIYLDAIFDSSVMLTNFAVVNFEAGLIPQRTSEYGGSTFKVAEIGKPLAAGVEFSEIAPIQIVYGVVGDYYIVCTQEVFFKQCVDANKAGKAMRIEIEGKPHRLAKTPVLAMNAQPDRFGSFMLSWVKLFEANKQLPQALGGQAFSDPETIEALKDVAAMFQQYALVKMQLWTGEDGIVIGRAQLTAPQ